MLPVLRRVILSAGVAATAAVMVVPAAADSTSSTVLGARAFAENGSGFGTVRPKEFFNGGDPSGRVSQIHWSSWGGKSAYGTGRNPIFKPQGGYYAKLGTVRLWAHGRSHCPGSTRPAYTRLSVRFPKRPGGPLGPWQDWAGAKTICSFP